MTLAVADRTGAPLMQLRLAEALRSRGHRVRLIHGAESATSHLDEQRRLGVEVLSLPALARPLPGLTARSLAERCAGADAVIAFHQRDRAVAMEAATRLGVPGVACVGNQHVFHGGRPAAGAKRWYYRRRLSTMADLLVCTSDAVRAELVAMGVPARRCVVLPNGIRTGTGPPRPERSRDPGDGTCTFVTVGRLTPQKGHDLLLRAWAQAGMAGAGHRLRVIGGPCGAGRAAASLRHAAGLHRLVGELGLAGSVELVGQSDAVPVELALADGYVHAARWEGPALPLAVLEAMDAGLPVITTDCSGWPGGFRQGRHGWVVPAGDVEGLAAALGRLVALGPAGRALYGRRCSALVHHSYDISILGDRFVDLVEKAMEAA